MPTGTPASSMAVSGAKPARSGPPKRKAGWAKPAAPKKGTKKGRRRGA